MKKTFLFSTALALILAATPALASKMSVSGADGIKKDEMRKLTLSLSKDDGTPLAFNDLKDVHTSKLHLLIVDDSLSDYHHIHPQADKEPGSYIFDFTPHTAHNYTIWADITPVKAPHEYLGATVQGEEPCGAPCLDKTVSLTGAAEGLKGALTLDGPLRKGEMAMATLTLTGAAGKPVTDLQPVMGAFAHVVGFYSRQPGVAHIHPLGEEPTSEKDRGGPELMFHLEPAQSGILKLFAQVKRGGKEIFIPFTLDVK